MKTQKFSTTRFDHPGALLVVGAEWFQKEIGGLMSNFRHEIWFGTDYSVVFQEAKGEQIDLMLVEELGDGRGYKFCSDIKEDETLSTIPVILVCHKNGPAALETAFVNGANDAIGFPLTQNLLNARIKIQLKYHNAVGELRETLSRLEERVLTRTAEFLKANERLKEEMVARERAQSELRKKEEQIRQAQKLEAAGQLAGGVAHDFNNLLTIITGHCDLMNDYVAPEAPVRKNLREIQKASIRAASLVRQLLAFSRKQVMNPTVLCVNDIIRDQIELVGKTMGESILVVTKLAKDLGNIKADRGQIDQALLNIVLNAKDAMPDGGRLSLNTRNVHLKEAWSEENDRLNPGHYVQVEISDTGRGMSETTRRRIFEPFFTTKETGKGSGLGLAMAYGIVRQSGGSIQVRSREAQGSTFHLYFPRVDAVRTANPLETQPKLESVGSGTILLVEDEEGVRTLLDNYLTAAGFTILAACNGQEATFLAQECINEIDVLVTDIVMPIMGGRELAKNLRAHRPNLPIVYMSGYAPEDSFSAQQMEKGCEFIRKPFTPGQLSVKIRTALAQGGKPVSPLGQ